MPAADAFLRRRILDGHPQGGEAPRFPPASCPLPPISLEHLGAW